MYVYSEVDVKQIRPFCWKNIEHNYMLQQVVYSTRYAFYGYGE
jgi:hypothetical protein